MDIIVFNQKELDNASAARSIALCDNDFNIAPSENTEYTAIGKVNAVVGCSAVRAVALGMTFIGFTPVFDEDLKIQKIPHP